jgi:hypothetical protein
MGAGRAPASIAEAVETYMRERRRREQEFDVKVPDELGAQVRSILSRELK